MKELSEQAKVDIQILDAAIGASKSDGNGKELAIWRAGLVNGKMRELGPKRRIHCHNIMRASQGRERSGMARIDWSRFTPGPLPKLPPGMTQHSPRHGVR